MPNVLSPYGHVQRYMEYEEKIITLEKITGRSIDDLINLFLKGYTLKEPINNERCRPNMWMEELHG